MSENKPVRVLILFMLTLLNFSCENFDSEEYLAEEENAIIDLLPEMVDADYMLANNDYGTTKPSLYLIQELFNEVKLPEDEPEIEIAEGDRIYPPDNYKLTKLDKDRLVPLTAKKILPRNISNEIVERTPLFNIKILPKDEFFKNHNSLGDHVERERLFGYLLISRVVFYDDFTTGYIYFGLFCGDACAWDSCWEIRKVNGHWIQYRYLFGGIA